MSWLKKLLSWLKEIFGEKRDSTSSRPASWTGEIVPGDDNRLVNPGRKLIWFTPGGKRIEQYDSGYIEGWFTNVIRAHWTGIRTIFTKKLGPEYSAAPCDIVRVCCEVIRMMPVGGPTAARAIWADTGEAVANVPDWTVWYVTFGWRDGPTIMFGHSHVADTMRDKYGLPNATLYMNGQPVFTWCCNHPHVVRADDGSMQRVDIRYTGGDRTPVVVTL